MDVVKFVLMIDLNDQSPMTYNRDNQLSSPHSDRTLVTSTDNETHRHRRNLASKKLYEALEDAHPEIVQKLSSGVTQTPKQGHRNGFVDTCSLAASALRYVYL